jgi:t-SNARE complex subunit (syntaxin)
LDSAESLGQACARRARHARALVVVSHHRCDATALNVVIIIIIIVIVVVVVVGGVVEAPVDASLLRCCSGL